MHKHPTLYTARLLLHVPPIEGRLAAWSLMMVATTNGHPQGDILARGHVPFPGSHHDDFRVWEALDRVVEQHAIH